MATFWQRQQHLRTRVQAGFCWDSCLWHCKQHVHIINRVQRGTSPVQMCFTGCRCKQGVSQLALASICVVGRVIHHITYGSTQRRVQVQCFKSLFRHPCCPSCWLGQREEHEIGRKTLSSSNTGTTSLAHSSGRIQQTPKVQQQCADRRGSLECMVGAVHCSCAPHLLAVRWHLTRHTKCC